MGVRDFFRERGLLTPRSLEQSVPTPLTGLSIRLNRRVGHRLVKDRSDDGYIVSFPRSGNTWLRTILANLIDPTVETDPLRRLALIPGVSIRTARRINALGSPRLLKSHATYLGRLPRALYLVRDGRDALVSLYHMRIVRPGHAERVSFADFCRRYFRGDLGERWDEHVLSWMKEGAREMGDALRVLKFEDLKAEVPGRVAEVTAFFGIESSREEIAGAVGKASLERLRETERARLGDLAPERSLYRGGKTGQWRELLVGELLDRFMTRSREALALAGYPE